MPSFGLLIVSYFLLVVFISDQFSLKITNPFLSYYDIQIRFILNHFVFFCLGFFGLTLLFFRVVKLRKHHLLKQYIYFVRETFVLLVGGSLASFILLFIIATIEINVLSVFTYINPRLLGVESNTQVIADKLKKEYFFPVIIAGGREGNILPLTIAVAQSGKSSFYGSRVIPFIPDFLSFPPKKLKEGVLMVGDSLIITDLNSSDFQKVSPVVSYLMIKKYFPDKSIKSYPEVILMDKNEYLSFRKNDFNNKLKKFDEVIANISEDSKLLNANIEDLKLKVIENQAELKQMSKQKEKEYTKCVNEGYYKEGVYYKTNSVSYCEEKVAYLEDLLKQVKNEGEELIKELAKDELKLKQYEVYEKFYSSQRLITKEESTYITFEFGTFNPPDTIKISLATQNDSKAAADLLVLIIHEYLHYATYQENGEKLASSFFQEGLTEYFARNIVKNYLGINTNLGYPANIKIIEQIAKRIDEGDFADIYFANDQIGLEKLLDRVYGKDFYRNNLVLFETLQYSSDSKQILQIAADIMSEIGGNPLGESDLTTTYSTFQ